MSHGDALSDSFTGDILGVSSLDAGDILLDDALHRLNSHIFHVLDDIRTGNVENLLLVLFISIIIITATFVGNVVFDLHLCHSLLKIADSVFHDIDLGLLKHLFRDIRDLSTPFLVYRQVEIVEKAIHIANLRLWLDFWLGFLLSLGFGEDSMVRCELGKQNKKPFLGWLLLFDVLCRLSYSFVSLLVDSRMIVKKLDNNVDNFSLFRWIGTVLEGIELIAMKEPVFAIDYSSHEANSHNWIILRRDNVMIVLHCKVQIIFSRHNLLSLIT